jgi:glutamine synthetase
MEQITDYFGSLVFNDEVMRNRLPKDTYKTLKKTITEDKELDISVANVVAEAMKNWALENGATHFTHWFQPMTGITAEKHDSFISPVDGGKVILEFSGKELIKGEPDASSFPSGGIRSTFEARGYTAWDPTSYAFIKDKCLCIPTAFCSYGGQALDKKTPLLRSMQALSKQAVRALKLFGNEDVISVKTTVGPEQEYFLVDKDLYEKRPDLIYTGRTLVGAKSPKGQELADHYFGVIKPRVKEFMEDLNKELWKLGILAKTEHNEVAPAQHELAPIFATTNVAADHNQLTMEIMQKVAKRHNMVCLLHEKPFAGVNGSGKHNNWSMATNTGVNLLEPGDTPALNAQFLLFLTATIKAVDEYQDLLRISVASAGNDFRLGANEAPPAIVSIFLGDELDAVLNAIAEDKVYKGQKEALKIGVDVLPPLPKDTTDRNRTSPFAFTGNKFEFRMLGSSESISCANIMLNTAVAKELDEFSTILENSKDFDKDLHNLIKKTIIEHKRIIFNGNGYTDSWVMEAEKRGLLNLKSTPEALAHYIDEKNLSLLEKYGVFTREETTARYEINLEKYSNIVHIEAQTLIEMLEKDIIPAGVKYETTLLNELTLKKGVNIKSMYEEEAIKNISTLVDSLYTSLKELKSMVNEAPLFKSSLDKGLYYRNTVLEKMTEARKYADLLEVNVSKEVWPYPSYGDLLFGVK